MALRRHLLVGTGTIFTAVLAAACGGGGNGDGAKTLASGTYEFVVNDIPADTCWPGDDLLHGLLLGQEVPFEITVVNDTRFTATPVGGAIGDLLPEIEGTRTGDTLSASGSTVLSLTTACAVGVDAALANAHMTGDSQFTAELVVGLDASVLTTAGTPSDCTALTVIPNDQGLPIPMPAALRTNGACSLTLAGNATAQ